MRPFYDDGFREIYHADCREILALIDDPASVALVLADPPYGMKLDTGYAGRGPTRAARSAGTAKWAVNHPSVVGDDQPFDPSHLLQFPRVVLFGANYFADRLPPSGAWIVWDKKRGGSITPGWQANDAELAWTNLPGSVRVFAHLWAGYKRDSEIGQHLHPTQKPVALMAWIIEQFTKPGDVILDPYMGSGPVLRAAKDLGRRAIGIEVEERYCEIAAKRLGQEVLNFA